MFCRVAKCIPSIPLEYRTKAKRKAKVFGKNPRPRLAGETSQPLQSKSERVCLCVCVYHCYSWSWLFGHRHSWPLVIHHRAVSSSALGGESVASVSWRMMMVWGPGAWSGVCLSWIMGPIPFFTLAVPGGYESMYSILRTYSVQFMPKFCFGGLGLTDLRCCCSLGRLSRYILPAYSVICVLSLRPENKHRFWPSLTKENLYDLIVSLDYLH